MADAARHRLSYAEYLRLERETGRKHELLDGVAVAMAGGTVVHALVINSVGAELRSALRGRPCRTFGSELKVRTPATGLATYPDASVVCGDLALDAEDRHAVTNPVVLVEVLSKSTEGWDRGDKFVVHYRTLESLRHYVLVAQSERRIEVFTRDGDGWTFRAYGPGEAVPLPAIEAEIAVDAVYAGTEGLLGEERAEGPER